MKVQLDTISSIFTLIIFMMVILSPFLYEYEYIEQLHIKKKSNSNN